jgi:hypothetical protein
VLTALAASGHLAYDGLCCVSLLLPLRDALSGVGVGVGLATSWEEEEPMAVTNSLPH